MGLDAIWDLESGQPQRDRRDVQPAAGDGRAAACVARAKYQCDPARQHVTIAVPKRVKTYRVRISALNPVGESKTVASNRVRVKRR